MAQAMADGPDDEVHEVSRVLSRLVARGHTLAELERLLQLSSGYLSKVRHHRARPSPQLVALLLLLETNPTPTGATLRQLGRGTPGQPKRVVVEATPPPVAGAARAVLLALVPELERRRVPWALGGAVALEALGLPRETTDVDIYVDDAHRPSLRLFRDAGMALAHFSDEVVAAYPVAGGENDRIDIIFPSAEPARSALRHPERRSLQGLSVPVLPAVSLAALKLMARRPKEHADALRLLDAGLASRLEVRALLMRLARRPVRDRWRAAELDAVGALRRLEAAG